ncbi:hypothetical protein CR513_04984, partial [Mucuna pruriens]
MRPMGPCFELKHAQPRSREHAHVELVVKGQGGEPLKRTPSSRKNDPKSEELLELQEKRFMFSKYNHLDIGAIPMQIRQEMLLIEGSTSACATYPFCHELVVLLYI